MASNKNDKSKRPYQLKERARRHEETRRRITEAAVRLHGSVGPARTTVSEIARLAGVRRMTVYNHFPTDADLIDACSSHWMARNPPPDHTAWALIGDPKERCRVALREMYAWYREKQKMMGNTIRDAALVPSLDAVMREKWWPLVDAMADVLAEGRASDGPDGAEMRALLRLFLDFNTWRSLTRSGLDDDTAARLASRCLGA